MKLRVFSVDLGPGALVALTALAVATVIVAVLARSPRRQATVEELPSPTAISVSFHEFTLSDEYHQVDDGFVFFRERVSTWSEEQVEQFWQPVDDVIEGYLRQQNDRRIELLFADVP